MGENSALPIIQTNYPEVRSQTPRPKESPSDNAVHILSGNTVSQSWHLSANGEQRARNLRGGLLSNGINQGPGLIH